jgi:hypothetical protein
MRGGSHYWVSNGVWYRPHGGSFVVVRPPHGVFIGVLPAFATVVAVGGPTYYYANDVYYRPLTTGGYEVVDPPPADPAPNGATSKLYVYPRQGQSAEQQASNEYECHRWAVAQTGFDPTLDATGQASGNEGLRADYSRAYAACLDGRGYTVR